VNLIKKVTVARENFLSEEGDLEAASLRVAPVSKAMRKVPWTALAELKGNPDILKKIDNAEALLRSLRKTLSS
jgi:ParB family chromosome partitioning protein